MILIVSATRSNLDGVKNTSLTKSLLTPYQSIDFEHVNIDDEKGVRANLNGVLDILYIYENTLPIGKVYNKAIRFALNNTLYTTILFIHDDVIIEDRSFERKVNEGLKAFDIIGLAGGANVSIKRPCLWHIMSKERYGTVGHFINGHWYGTTFGPSNTRVTIIDGLFIGVETKTLREKPSLRFDDKLPGFHHYDIDFCLSANKAKCKIGVVPIITTHHSPGLLSFNDVKYQTSEDYFLQKHK